MNFEPPVEFLLKALAEDSAARVLLIDAGSGSIRWANAIALDAYTPEEGVLIGAPPTSFLPDGISADWMAAADESRVVNGPVILDMIVRGVAVRTTFRPFPGTNPPLVLAVGTTAYHRAMDDDVPVRAASTADLGALASLTPRERQIIGLIGDGLTSAAIAERLERSIKTIEWHRVSIGQKLGVKSRVELAGLARRAGLCSTPAL
ncbi:MAG: helix-turn-helix transcriptional regulator [Phycisphaeraceae bacterium]|nr:helix-turn-helix transcriptional regulator [Phycisphaeraceae bacterium]